MGLFFRKTAPSADVLEDGIRGKAKVEHVEESGWSMEVNVRTGRSTTSSPERRARSAKS